MKVKTKVVKTINGHTAQFTIGVQTFSLTEQISELGCTSYKHAKWYKQMLDHAFKNLVSQEGGK